MMIKTRKSLQGYVLITVLLLIIIAIALLPWLSGLLFKNDYHVFLKNLSQETQTEITVIEYHVGWLQSKAKVSIKINAPSAKYGNQEIILMADQTIFHGPLVYDRIQQKYQLAEAIIHSTLSLHQSPLAPTPIQFSQFMFETIANFTHGFNHYFSILPYHLTIPAFKLDWQGMSGHFFMQSEDNYFSQIKSDSSVQPLTMTGPGFSMQLQGINLKSDFYKSAKDELWQGEDSLTVSSLNAEAKGKSYILTDYHAEGSFKNNAEAGYDLQSMMSLQKLTLPTLTFNSSKLSFKLMNLNRNILKQIINDIPNVKANPGLSSQYLPLFYQLIMPTTYAASDLNMSTSEGNFNLSTKIAWQKELPLPKNPQELIKGLNGELHVRISSQLVDFILQQLEIANRPMDYENRDSSPMVSAQPEAVSTVNNAPSMPNTPAMQPTTVNVVPNTELPLSPKQKFNQFIQQGYIVQENTDYVIEIRYQNGILIINNKQIPLPF